MVTTRASKSAVVRARVNHSVIDSDGHTDVVSIAR